MVRFVSVGVPPVGMHASSTTIRFPLLFYSIILFALVLCVLGRDAEGGVSSVCNGREAHEREDNAHERRDSADEREDSAHEREDSAYEREDSAHERGDSAQRHVAKSC